jgi:hypothetical protein
MQWVFPARRSASFTAEDYCYSLPWLHEVIGPVMLRLRRLRRSQENKQLYGSCIGFSQPTGQLRSLPSLILTLIPGKMFLISFLFILNMATASRAIICGYMDGDPQIARSAAPGYECRVDTSNGLWGFCLTTMIASHDCYLAGVCVDTHSCTEGCGRLSGRADITTLTWSVIP